LGGLPGAPEAAAAPRPTAVVVLGDSAASGDGAGSYQAGTRGGGCCQVPSTAVNTAGIYARISIDKSGRKEGVEAQEKWGRAYAAEHWPGFPVRVFKDNNLSP